MPLKRLLTAGLIGVLTLTATPAFAAIAPNTVALGSRGADVGLAQRLLTYRGYPVAVTERIGPTTEGLIEAFQRANGLAADGVVGAGTWRRLYPTLRQGDSNKAVEALQIALYEKHGYDIPATGFFGAMTAAAVRDFQGHMGLSADGIVGPQTWDALAGHFQSMPASGPGFFRYNTINPDGHYGTSNAITTLKAVAADWARLGYPALGIGDVSFPHGGAIPGHASHRRGVDVDIRAFRYDGAKMPVNYYDSAYSRRLTQALVDKLLATGEVEVIFFNDPNVRGVTYWPNHDEHLHVRFYR